jgi:hypothetical protein
MKNKERRRRRRTHDCGWLYIPRFKIICIKEGLLFEANIQTTKNINLHINAVRHF